MLCYAMLCYAMLCYAMLCYAMLCYAMLCYVMLCYVMLCYVMLCYVMLCYVMLCYVMLCYVMLCYVMLCCAMLCYAMLLYTILSLSELSNKPFIIFIVSSPLNIFFSWYISPFLMFDMSHPYFAIFPTLLQMYSWTRRAVNSKQIIGQNQTFPFRTIGTNWDCPSPGTQTTGGSAPFCPN